MKKKIIITGYFIFFWLVIPISMYWLSVVSDSYIFPDQRLETVWIIPGIVTGFAGLLLLLLSVYQFKKQSGEFPVSATPPSIIIKRGLFSVWRHPIYLFGAMTLFGSVMIIGSFSLLLIVLPIFMVIVIIYLKREESILIQRFGNEYIYHKNIVRVIIPHFHQWLRLTGFFIFKFFFRIKVINKENIPASLPFIVISGHRHYLDPFFISYAVHYPLTHISTFEMFRKPMIRKIFTMLGAIPRKRYLNDIPGTRKILKAIENGIPICMFPEGGRSWTGQLRPYKTEALKLLQYLKDIPVLPVRIEGNYHSWPRWSDTMKKSQITVTFEKPIFINPAMAITELENQLKTLTNPRFEIEEHSLCMGKNIISHLSFVIYRCPHCFTLKQMDEIPPNILHCKSCDSNFIIDQNYNIVFELNNEKKIESIQTIYDKIKVKYSDIYKLSSEVFNDVKNDVSDSVGRVLYSSKGQLWIEENLVFKKYINGLCILGEKSFQVHNENNSLEIQLESIGAVTIESNYKLQIYNEINKTLYQITFENDSALKWQDIFDTSISFIYNKKIITR
jgi:1-acyl-sn-glycerol-3-phosphate acyltransferase